MAINFPNNPVDGSTYTYLSVNYTYLQPDNNFEGYWAVVTQNEVGVASIAEVNAGVDNTKYISPLGLAGSNTPVPAGVIVMWSGSVTNIPETWALCNGTNGTPDLRDRFILGASNDASVGVIGGSADSALPIHVHTGPSHTHTSAIHSHSTPNHSHSASAASGGEHNHTYNHGFGTPKVEPYNGGDGQDFNMNYTRSTNNGGAHSHSITVNSGGASNTGNATPPNTGASGTGATGYAGVSNVDTNLPPYMKLAYIMKL